jgi:hypothetical protein
MARRVRHGLDYFPLDTSWDLRMRLLKVQYGLEGLGVAVQLLQMIYREGYCLTWNAETIRLFCAENAISEPRLAEILDFCLDHGLFDRRIFEQHQMLTSAAIQRQWIRICTDAKRKNISINPAINLCNDDEQSSEETTENSGNFPGTSRNAGGNIRVNPTERKEKEIKEKNMHIEEKQPDIGAFIKELVNKKRELDKLL